MYILLLLLPSSLRIKYQFHLKIELYVELAILVILAVVGENSFPLTFLNLMMFYVAILLLATFANILTPLLMLVVLNKKGYQEEILKLLETQSIHIDTYMFNFSNDVLRKKTSGLINAVQYFIVGASFSLLVINIVKSTVVIYYGGFILIIFLVLLVVGFSTIPRKDAIQDENIIDVDVE